MTRFRPPMPGVLVVVLFHAILFVGWGAMMLPSTTTATAFSARVVLSRRKSVGSGRLHVYPQSTVSPSHDLYCGGGGSLPSTALRCSFLPLYCTAVPEDQPPVEEAEGTSLDDPTATKTLLQWIRSYFVPKKDNLTFRQRLAKMGLAAVLSYGWVSNMSYSVTVSLAWYIFSKQTGKSPLAPGQWKGFLAVYAGFWVFNNLVRPIRLAFAVAISPQFDNIVLRIQNRLKVSKATAITVTVVIANLIGTIFFMSAGVLFASVLAGVPIFVR